MIRTLAIAALLAAPATAVATAAPTSSAGTAACRGQLKPLRTPALAYAADVPVAARVYRKPGGAPMGRFGPYNVNGYPTVFGVLSSLTGPGCQGTWYRVQLAMKPNGITGYVRASSVRLRRVTARIVVDVSARRVMLFRHGRRVLVAESVVGSAATPTPRGSFYVNQRFRMNAKGPYGYAALGISAFSEVLTGWVQGGPIAIHGTNRPSSIGRAVSNGCIRVPNDVLRRIWPWALAGTPVVVQA